MRRSNAQRVGEVLREFIRESGFDRKLREVDAMQSWEKLLGKTIAHYTRNIALKNGILYVEITSSIVKNELFMMRDEICRKMNEQAGERIVERLVFK